MASVSAVYGTADGIVEKVGVRNMDVLSLCQAKTVSGEIVVEEMEKVLVRLLAVFGRDVFGVVTGV